MSDEIAENDKGNGRLVGCLFLALFVGVCLFSTVGIGIFGVIQDLSGGGSSSAVSESAPPEMRSNRYGPPSVADGRGLDGPWQIQARFLEGPLCTFRVSAVPNALPPGQAALLTLEQTLGAAGMPCRTRIVCDGELLFVARDGLLCERHHGTGALVVRSGEEAGTPSFLLDEHAGTITFRDEDGGLIEGRIESIR